MSEWDLLRELDQAAWKLLRLRAKEFVGSFVRERQYYVPGGWLLKTRGGGLLVYRDARRDLGGKFMFTVDAGGAIQKGFQYDLESSRKLLDWLQREMILEELADA